MEPTINIAVPPSLRDFFRETQIHGQGGFQSLARMLADRLTHSKVLRLTPDELRRIVHYARAYGEGGFQSRLRALVVEYVFQTL